MRILVALIAIALLTVTASAQGSGKRPKKPAQATEDMAKKKLDEKDYKAALEKLPAAEQKPDPWKNMR